MNLKEYKEQFKTGQYICKVHLDMLKAWHKVDLIKENPTYHDQLLVKQYVEFIHSLYDAYCLDMYKHRIDYQTGEITWWMKQPEKKQDDSDEES